MTTSRRTLPFALLTLSLVGIVTTRAQEGSPPSTVSTAVSQPYPQVTCAGTNAGVCADVIQLAADTRDRLASRLRLGGNWRFPVHIHVVMPDDPLAAKIQKESVAVTASDKAMTIDAALPASDPQAREFIQRQFVTALLWEKFFDHRQSFDAQTRLDVVPLWLVEGLREWLDDDPEHNRASIVKRAVRSQHAPTLDEVTSWQILSEDRLLGLWQRAFCYYLVNSLIRQDAKLGDFQRWLDTVSGPTPSSARYLFPTETGWQRELVDATGRSHDIVYTWDETVAEIAAAETISIPSAESANTRICTLDTVCGFPCDKNLNGALQQKVLDLTTLELRAHPSWTPILASYRFGLTALLDNKPKQAEKFIREARRQRSFEMVNHQKIFDYVNWFEVTRDYGGGTSQFRSYFSTAEEMERMEADPSHPNPIRASLLKVESRL